MKGKNVFHILISFFIILPLVSIAGCDLSSNDSRRRARKHACYANMRVLMGAVEMYNMDQDDASEMHRILPSDYLATSGRLISGKYLRTPMQLPEKKCAYFVRGDLVENDSKICCDLHGTSD